MKEPIWLLKSAVFAVHNMMVARFGGPVGIRDERLIADEVSATAMTLSLAASGIDENDYGIWLPDNIEKL